MAFDLNILASFILTRILFEEPTLILVIFAIPASLLSWLSQKHKKSHLFFIARSLAVVGLLLMLTSWLVVTDKEEIEKVTKQLGKALHPVNMKVLTNLVTSEATLQDENGDFVTTFNPSEMANYLSNLKLIDNTAHVAFPIYRSESNRGQSSLFIESHLPQNKQLPAPYLSAWSIVWEKKDDGSMKATTFRISDQPGQRLLQDFAP